MRIEQINKTKLSKAFDKELLILKLRFTQLFDKNFKDDADVIVGSLNRGKFLKNYRLLLGELNNRKIEYSTGSIDKAAFKKAMSIKKLGVDVSDFDDIVIYTDYIAIPSDSVGEAVEFIKQRQAEIKVTKHVEPESAYIPLYDLVLKAKPSTQVIEVSKPYPNEHSARLKNPDKFDSKSFKRTKGGLCGSKKIPITISIIWGKFKNKVKPSDPPIAIALRFPTKTWTAAKAKKWLADNEITYIKFEPAVKAVKKLWGAKYISQLPDSAFLYIEDDISKSRHFPYIDSDNKIDLPHLRKALARIPQSSLSKDIQVKVIAKADKILADIKDEKCFDKSVGIYPIDKADEEHIVCGIVYEPDVEDSQGDFANEDEIRKAAYDFMEKAQKIKVMHKGNQVKVKILESYLAPQDLTIASQPVKKGTWVLTARILDAKIWKAVKDGETLTGWSMAGYASGKES